MRGDTYSTYEAKAHLSELLRKVQQRRRIVITSHGRPIAQVLPFDPAEDETFAQRVERLRASGLIEGANLEATELEPVAKRRGALARFLADRD